MVYAGAVIVLFLFVIMLLDIPSVEQRSFNLLGVGMGGLGLLAIGGMVIQSILRSGMSQGKTPQLEGATKALGVTLFTEYVLAFEIMGVLLLVGMMGVILLSKKDLKQKHDRTGTLPDRQCTALQSWDESSSDAT